MSDQLQIDLEALGRLSPQVRGLADRLSGDHDGADAVRGPTVPAGGETPSLIAARTVSTDVVPGVERQVANRFTVVADLVTEAGRRMGQLDEQGLQQMVSTAPSLLPQQS